MDGYGGHGIGTPLLRRDRLTIGSFEPEDRGSQDAALRQEIADPGFNSSQVLADYHRARPICLQDQDVDHRVMVVTHVRSS